MRHRVFLVPLRPDVDEVSALDHWTTIHAPLFAGTPHLRAYVQNRPEESGHRVVCSETWFDDRASERAAYGSAVYTDEVTKDETTFLQREAAWSALVRDDPPAPTAPADHPPGTFRALVFGWSGTDLPAGPGTTVVALDRPGPRGGPARLLSAWDNDPDALARVLAEPGDAHLLTRPHVVVPYRQPAG